MHTPGAHPSSKAVKIKKKQETSKRKWGTPVESHCTNSKRFYECGLLIRLKKSFDNSDSTAELHSTSIYYFILVPGSYDFFASTLTTTFCLMVVTDLNCVLEKTTLVILNVIKNLYTTVHFPSLPFPGTWLESTSLYWSHVFCEKELFASCFPSTPAPFGAPLDPPPSPPPLIT